MSPPTARNFVAYLILGIASGITCSILDNSIGYVAQWFNKHYQATIFSGFLLFGGHFISNMRPRWGIVGFVIICVASIFGWWAAREIYFAASVHSFVLAGGIGGLCVSIGLTGGWQTSSAGNWRFIVLITTAGILGGAFCILAPRGLYVIWQSTVMLGIGIAVHLDLKRKNAATI